MKPRLALVYSKDEATAGMVEVWRVVGNKLIDPRQPSKEALSELASCLRTTTDKEDLHGMIGPRVLYLKKSVIAFFEPAGIHTTYYAATKGPSREVRIWTPNTVFIYNAMDQSVKVYWLRGDIQDAREHPACLMAAAMPNVDRHGHMCMGTAFQHVKMNNVITDVCHNVSKAFYGSAFTEWRTEDIGPIMAWCEKAVNRKKDAMTNWVTAVGRIRDKLRIRTLWSDLEQCIEL